MSEDILALLISCLAVYHYVRRPLRSWGLIITAIGVLLFLTLGGQLRAVVERGLVSFSGLELGIQSVLARFGSREFDQAANFAVILHEVPRYLDYQWGKTYLAIIPNPVPRFLFPNKPLGGGGVFTKALMPEYWYSGTGLTPSMPGELFMNLGISGILFGMWIYGLVSKMLYIYFQSKKRNPSVLVLYSVVAYRLGASVRGEFLSSTVEILFLALPVLAVRVFCSTDGSTLIRERKGAAS